MKRYALLVLMCLLPFLPALAETTPESVLDSLDTGALETLFESAGGENFRDTVLRLARGETVLSAQELLKALSDAFLSALFGSLKRLPLFVAPCVLCGAAARAAYAACYLLLAGLLVRDLSVYMALVRDAVTRMAGVMQALFPLLLTLLAAIGAASSAFFGPAVVAAGGALTTVIEQVTLRCALASAVTGILNNLSEGMRLKRLSSLFRQMAAWTLGVSFTVFLGVTAAQGMGAAAADGVTLRAAKYAADNFIPVVGGMFADTMDTLMGCSLLIKNAVGVTGLFVLLSASLPQIAQAAAGVLLYRGAAALLSPVGDERLVKCLNDFSVALMLLLVVLLSVFAMFILLAAQLLSVGNRTVGYL